MRGRKIGAAMLQQMCASIIASTMPTPDERTSAVRYVSRNSVASPELVSPASKIMVGLSVEPNFTKQ